MIAKPKVSVLLPSYNYAHFLDEAIQSVLDQTFTDFELIIVDNNSSDHTADVVAKYLYDRRVRYCKNERTLRLPENWNKSLEYASGGYVKILCADDKMHPEMLERFVAVMDQHPSVSIIACYDELFGDFQKKKTAPFNGLIKGDLARESMLRHGNWLGAPTSTMFRHSLMKGMTFHPQLHHSIDIEFYFQLLAVGDAYVVPEFLSYTRTHAASVTSHHAKTMGPILEGYRYMRVIKDKNQNANSSFKQLVKAEVERRAIRCTTVMYKLLPKIYQKDTRKVFFEAFHIGYKENVHFKTIARFLNVNQLFRPSD